MRQIASTLLAALGIVGVAIAHEDHDHGAPHGGTVVRSQARQFEVVFTPSGVQVYPLTQDKKPVDSSKLTGTVTFYHPSAPGKRWFERPLRPMTARPGQTPTSLGLAIDLSKAPSQGVTTAFQVAGFADATKPSSDFTVPFSLPITGDIAITTATITDQAAINALKVCPVSHEGLGSMGTPLKVTRGGKATFICCKSCVKEIQAHPDKYLGSSSASPTPKDERGHKH